MWRIGVVFVIFTLLISGCGSAVTTKNVPEPYTLAQEDIVLNRWDSAIEKLDITIKDFPDNAYESRVLKTIIYFAEIRAYQNQMWAFINGGKASSSSENKTFFITQAKALEEKRAEKIQKLNNEMIIILQQYNNQPLSFDLSDYCTADTQSVSVVYDRVSRTGEVLAEYDMDKALKSETNFYFASYLLYSTGHTSEAVIETRLKGQIIYPAYFELIGTALFNYDTETRRTGEELLKKVILIEDNKYGCYRLEAESVLNKK